MLGINKKYWISTLYLQNYKEDDKMKKKINRTADMSKKERKTPIIISQRISVLYFAASIASFTAGRRGVCESGNLTEGPCVSGPPEDTRGSFFDLSATSSRD